MVFFKGVERIATQKSKNIPSTLLIYLAASVVRTLGAHLDTNPRNVTLSSLWRVPTLQKSKYGAASFVCVVLGRGESRKGATGRTEESAEDQALIRPE